MLKTTSFAELYPAHKALFFDAFGVLNAASGLLPGVRELLHDLNRTGKPYFVLTNDSSVSLDKLSEKYHDRSLGRLVPPERIICSGLIAQKFLEKNLPDKKYVYLGQRDSSVFLDAASADVHNLDDIAADEQADVFALMSVNGYDWQTALNKSLNFIRRQDQLTLLAPNPDLIYHAQHSEVGIAGGGLAAMLERLTSRTFQYFGKPHREIFDYAMGLLHAELPGVKPSEVLMVGDNLTTDIRGARDYGLVGVLCLSGITKEDAGEREIARTGIEPHYVCRSLG